MLQGQFFAEYSEADLSHAADMAGRSLAKELAEADSAPMPPRARSSDIFTGDQPSNRY